MPCSSRMPVAGAAAMAFGVLPPTRCPLTVSGAFRPAPGGGCFRCGNGECCARAALALPTAGGGSDGGGATGTSTS
eukprot:364848-Chlamydomonas_euryale.AAC.3